MTDMNNDYISVNVVSQSLILLRYIQKNECFSNAEIQQIRFPFNINKKTSFDFAIQCNWITLNNDVISVTQIGREILQNFDNKTITLELWKIILQRYISVCQPAWAKRIPYGRKEAYLFMSEEEQRCFVEANLISSYDDDVIDWWDNLAEIERVKKYEILDDIGRNAEKLTFKYEEIRTGRKPHWVSIESNLAGYDILSQKSSSNVEKILIEVKSTSQSMTSALLNVTRHEWNVAILENNLERYFFYLWIVSASEKKLAIISVGEMSQHIPIDNKKGEWEKVKIPYVVFSESFCATRL